MMKKRYNFLCGALLAAGALLTTSCVGDLDQFPHIEQTSATVYTSVDNYKAVLGKLYVAFTIAGQEKGGGNADLTTNKGWDYMRNYFNMQECGTDEVVYTWLAGDNMTGLTYLSWDANDLIVSDMYYRIYYNIALCNEFLRNATDDRIASFSEADQEEIRHYRAEARFLRALAYSHAMDLFRNVPFVTEADPVGSYVPPRYTSAQIFDYVENELLAIDADLLDRTACEYGRACRQAAYALLARLYLNAEVYTGEARWTDCVTYCRQVIEAGYSLEPDYAKLFNADNQLRTNEIIFAFPVDATHTTSWGTTTYMVCGAINNASDFQVPADYGAVSGWGNFRMRPTLPSLFSDGDRRAMFFTEGQTLDIDMVEDQSNGYLTVKWTNLTDAGEAASNTTSDGVCTDYPVFRLADVYLMLAEAIVRGGQGATRTEALGYVNQVRERAYGDTSGNIVEAQMTTDFLLDERARELYTECVRRTDLIRYNRFTTADYLWQWKGGSRDGQAVDNRFNYYPIPSTELTANPNLYNEGY